MPVRVLGCKEKLTVDKLRRKRIDYNSRDPQEAQRIRFKNEWGTSLVVEWIRIHLLVQGTQVRSRFWKIPHAAGQLSLWATTTESAPKSLRVANY